MEQLNTDHYRPLLIIDKLIQQNDIFQPNLNRLSPAHCSPVQCHQTTSFSATLKGLSIPLVVITWKVSDHKKKSKNSEI